MNKHFKITFTVNSTQYTCPFKVREDFEMETLFSRTFSRDSGNLKHTLPLGRPIGWQNFDSKDETSHLPEGSPYTLDFPAVAWHRLMDYLIGTKIFISSLRAESNYAEEMWAVVTDETYQTQDTLYLVCVQLLRGE